MPVQKLATLEAARRALWGRPGDPRNLRELCELWAAAQRLCPWRFPPGVHRYRCLEEAASEMREWERQRFP